MILKKYFSYLLFLFPFSHSEAQENGQVWRMSAAMLQPVGIFQETHFTGLSWQMDYYPGKPDTSKRLTQKKWHPLLSTAVAFFPGRKKNISGYPFRYGNYGIWQFAGGWQYQPVQKLRIYLVAGPAMSYYQKNLRFNISAASGLSWNWNPRWGIGTTIGCWKESGADPLWMIGLKGSYAF